VKDLVRRLTPAARITVLTGAGVSAASGVPTFRGKDGLWKNFRPEALATAEAFGRDPSLVWEWYAWRRFRIATCEPNAAHLALADLDRTGRLDLLITQNIDGLHLAAGSPPQRVIEIHGSIRDSVCLACGDRRPMVETLDRVRGGDPDPSCLVCGGVLKSATVSFGQNLDPALLARAEEAAAGCDLFLAVGTSLTVYPAARLPEIAVDAGARLVIVNAESTPLDGLADGVLRGEAGDLLSAIVAPVVAPT